jgi:isopentenyl diphosphate isomerase/L-lactate dehydrogenase-like FMN-dependent dehydrogenase
MAVYSKYLEEKESSSFKSSGKDSGLSEYVKNHKGNEFSWEIINHIKSVSGLPVIAKGIMCKEDAILAVDNGADAVFVSNHGGRQLDTTPASIEVLEEVVEALKGRKVEIYFDGGIRRGSDILKAIAIGANAVFIGRPVIWGLACGGQEGVERALEILNDELKEAMI